MRLEMKDRPKEEVLAEIREKASLLPGTNVTVGQPISHRIDHMLSGTRANVAVKIFGDDLQMLRGLAAQVQAEMAQVEGVVDLSTEAQTEIPTLRVKVEPDAAARYGIPVGRGGRGAADRAGRQSRRPGARRAGRVPAGDSLRARRAASDLDAVGSTLLEAADRSQVPLSAVATIERDRGPNFIMRENVQRQTRRAVQRLGARPAERRRRYPAARRAVPSQLPQGYHIEYGGQFESEAQASRQLLWLSLGVDRRDLLRADVGVRIGARRGARHAEPAARADRRRRRASISPAACCRSPRSSASSRCSASPHATASC